MGAGLTSPPGCRGRRRPRRSAADQRAKDPRRRRRCLRPRALGVDVRTLPSHDGGELYLVERGRDGRPLVLLHGITLAARVWGYQLRDLSDRFRVIAVDLRGHGRVDGRDRGLRAPPARRRPRTVLESLDLRDAIVVGHSMGGMTLMQFCADHPDVLDERVAGVVFLATAGVVPLPAPRCSAR